MRETLTKHSFFEEIIYCTKRFLMQWNDPLLNGMHVMNLISGEWRYIKLITYNNVTMLTWIRINIGKGTEIDTEKYPVKVTNLAISIQSQLHLQRKTWQNTHKCLLIGNKLRISMHSKKQIKKHYHRTELHN